jgi:DNA topoisomerase-1
VSVIKDVAEQLGNTVAVCRKCYIHPRVLEALGSAEAAAVWGKARGRALAGLSDEERLLVAFLTADAQAAAA